MGGGRGGGAPSPDPLVDGHDSRNLICWRGNKKCYLTFGHLNAVESWKDGPDEKAENVGEWRDGDGHGGLLVTLPHPLNNFCEHKRSQINQTVWAAKMTSRDQK